MENIVTAPPPSEKITQELPRLQPRRVETHRVAWMVLSMSFFIFWVVCLSFSFGVYYYLFQSSVQMTATVKVANQGTVGLVSANLVERFEYDQEDVEQGDTLLTDAQSQSVITFRDADVGVVAAVTMKNGAELQVTRMAQPRFEWGQRNYHLMLEGRRGEIDVFIPQVIQRPINVTIVLPDGAVADLSDSGLYTLSIEDAVVRLAVHGGKAAMITPDRQDGRSVIANEIGIYDRATQVIAVNSGYEDLIVDNIFTHPPEYLLQMTDNDTSAFDLWNCSDRTNNGIADPDAMQVPGQLEWKMYDGRLALHFLRENTAAHGETGCIQPLGSSAQDGRYVGDYNYMALRSTFFIRGHSLQACGVAGSECPVMLRLDYVNTEGEYVKWLQGFYASHDPNIDYPLRCNGPGCEEHKRVSVGAWYSYESGNLFSLLTEDVPEYILNVQLYASGHAYDVYVSELSLLAGTHIAAPAPGAEAEGGA